MQNPCLPAIRPNDAGAGSAPSPDRARRFLRAGLLCGLLAPAIWAAAIVLAGALRPNFDHAAQYISELGERGSVSEAFMNYGGFALTGVMHGMFAVSFYLLLAASTGRRCLTFCIALLIAMDGLGRIGAGFFPCEPGCAAPEVLAQQLHGIFATIAFFSVIGAALLSPLVLRHDRHLRPFIAYSIASGCAGVTFLVLMSASEATRTYTGLYERLASAALSLWIFVIAAGLWASAGREAPDSGAIKRADG